MSIYTEADINSTMDWVDGIRENNSIELHEL